jgi:hypothetical protein
MNDHDKLAHHLRHAKIHTFLPHLSLDALAAALRIANQQVVSRRVLCDHPEPLILAFRATPFTPPQHKD